MGKIIVNEIDKETGSTLTLGGSGTQITLGCGATQTGFGRTGTVNWCTTAKTSPLTVASGNGYFINTTSGSITVTLPSSPSAGDIVAFKDYANTWDTNKVTVGRGGSKINGVAECATLATESQSVTLIYVDATKGWQDIHDSTSNVTGAAFIAASGGDATITCGDFKTHIFTGSGTFTVSSVAACAADNAVQYLVVAGGGGASGAPAGAGGTGAGGAGGFRMYSAAPGSNSPLNAPAGHTVSAQAYPIVVGAGGAGGYPSCSPPLLGSSGTVSTFDTISSAGGGFGSQRNGGNPDIGGTGGSGGGNGYGPGPNVATGGAAGNTPPVSPPQGNPGGYAGHVPPRYGGSGGGGAGAAGGHPAPAAPGTQDGGAGGDGSYIADPFIGPTAPSYGDSGPVSSTRYFAGGGGGGTGNNHPTAPGGTAGTGGAGGGGDGSSYTANAGSAGATNTGGGGGAVGSRTGKAGGSGIVMIRYRFQ